MYLAFRWFGLNVGGLFSPEYELAPWSWAKAWDLMWHLPLPAMILALAGTAQLIRIMRANLLDELQQALCRHRAGQGPERDARHPEVSGARRSQSVRQRASLSVSLSRFRQHHRLAGAQPADGRAGPARAP